MPPSSRYRPQPRITALDASFYDAVSPARFPRHTLRFRHQSAAEALGLDTLTSAEWEACFAEFVPLPHNLEQPLALRYHGHQFDVYNPALGDGRGFLYAQMLDARGRLIDLGTKGSGPTPWSRGGDGKLTLKGGVREVLATEMLEALGVETSRSFSLFETGESLVRGDEPSPTRSSVLVRASHSHVRFGTFQRLAFLRDHDGLARLLDYCVDTYFPHLVGAADRATAFLQEVTARTAKLTASFMVAGFVHGVLNSDNMNVTGESFDYGPYRFLPRYDERFVAAYFDEGGLYAYGRQPQAIFRNLMRLAESLAPIAPEADLDVVLSSFEAALDAETTRRTVGRLGLAPRGEHDDGELTARVFRFLSESDVGFERFFFDWYGGALREERVRKSAWGALYRGPAWASLRELMASYTPAQWPLPAYWESHAPCTLLIDEIERIWAAISARDDWSLFEEKVTALRAVPRPVWIDAAPAPSGAASSPAQSPSTRAPAGEHEGC